MNTYVLTRDEETKVITTPYLLVGEDADRLEMAGWEVVFIPKTLSPNSIDTLRTVISELCK